MLEPFATEDAPPTMNADAETAEEDLKHQASLNIKLELNPI